ncbi:MAG: cation:proton antiporter [candidate division SR1 bacterium]|nr:cation:proton antiporter [candidate division SR1 bacterium]
MSQQVFISLSVILGIVLIIMGIMRFFRQPMIIGYIIAGTVIGIFFPSLLHGNTALQPFSNIGISFLLFMVGMELNPRIIKELGKSSFIAGLLQVIATSIIGFFIARGFGCDIMTAGYLGIAFSFSSTIVVLKLLSDKEETESTFGRLSIGVLIIQDIIVLLIFLAIASYSHFDGGNDFAIIGTLALKIIGLGTAIYVASRHLIPKITPKIAESSEFLFLFAIGRCMLLGTVFYYLGLGIEFGTLVAGIVLSNSNFKYEITSKIKSLRDFFIVMYFVLLGSQVSFVGVGKYIPMILIFSLFILIIKPLITMIIFGLMGHTKKNNFLAGSSLGQISEFSFLLIGMGVALGHIKDTSLISTITIIGLLSIAASSYFILYGEKIYLIIKPILKYIPGSRNEEYKKRNQEEYEVIILGYGKFGSNLYETLIKKHKNILVIDEHPAIIAHLKKKGIPCIYGDAGDVEFIKELNIKGTKMIISTIKKFEDNMVIVKTIKAKFPHIIVILISNHVQESIKLYEEGADDVIMPHYIGAYHTSLMLEEYGFDLQKFGENKVSQISQLRNRHKDLMIEALQGKMN